VAPVINLGKTLQAMLSSRQETEPWRCPYSPSHLTHVTQVWPDGKVDVRVVIYLPKSYSPAAEALPQPQPLETWCVQVRVKQGSWQTLNRPETEADCWSLDLERLTPGSAVAFRYCDNQGQWRSLTPLTDLETVYGAIYVPQLTHLWQHESPRFNHAKVLLETTLEGLLAGYKGGEFAPRSQEEMFQASIAQRILKTQIPPRLAEWAIDEIMVPICSSVADRSQLDPKFNYLTHNVGDVDWQIGPVQDFMQLLDRLHAHGILMVPDLIFAHQVQDPFPGSLNQVERSWDGEKLLVDRQAFLFRDYGTWMFKLEDPIVRRLLVEKITAFVVRYRLRIVRIDYVDGLILQYSQRQENFGEVFIQELKAELRQVCPQAIVLGETFEVAGNPLVQDFIDVFYAPVGFSVVEELYKPPAKMARPQYPEVEHLVAQVNYAAYSKRQEAIYAQLHDETWYDQHIIVGRPYVPWAYGGNPAELAKRQGEELTRMGLLRPEQLLDYVRRTVRNAEALTLFTAKLRYMYVPGVDSLALGCLDDRDRWKVIWDGVTQEQMAHWLPTGLSERQIFWLHEQHRADMIQLRRIFRTYTKVDEETLAPQVQPQVFHVDPETAVMGIYRQSYVDPAESLLIVFNFGPQSFLESTDHDYELPVPEGLEGQWQVLFDGDWIVPHCHPPEEKPLGYAPGTNLMTAKGRYLPQSQVLSLHLGARSLVILRYCPS